MQKKLNSLKIGVKTWMMLILNLLLASVLAIVFVAFFSQFRDALDERIMLQLTSVKKLKRTQIENFINGEKEKFLKENYKIHPYKNGENPMLDSIAKNYHQSGLLDATIYSSDFMPQLALMKIANNKKFIKLIDPAEIQKILLERTGLGETGESYLVGSDYKLRSISRFYPNTPPYKITANTPNIRKAFAGNANHSISKDYREISVYSAYHPLEIEGIDWVILSEIDVKEAIAPLNELKKKLAITTFLVLLMGVFLSLLVSKTFSQPLEKLRKHISKMSEGEYRINLEEDTKIKELSETIEALNSLNKVLLGAIRFSYEIGNMNLDFPYQTTGKKDTLGISLMKMRDKLKEFQTQLENEEINKKKQLIRGQENERSRLSKELHDGIGPLLTAMRMSLQRSEIAEADKNKIKNLIDQTISETRRISNDLMPSLLIDFGLEKALEKFIQTLNDTTQQKIIFSFKSTKNKKIDKEKEIQIFRICQELLNNGLKHSDAQKIELNVEETLKTLRIIYKDNGKGFDENQINQGSGISNIKERVKILGGSLSIVSNFGETTIDLAIE